MEDKSYITKIVTETLNASFFKVGSFYVVIYPDGTKQLTVCTLVSGGQGVRLLVIRTLSGDSALHNGAGHLIDIDNKNLKDFVNILRYDISKFESGNFGDDIAFILTVV